MNQQPTTPHTRRTFCVLVCTKDRPEHLQRLLMQLEHEPLSALVVIDASSDDRTRELVRSSTASWRVPVVYEAMDPGLSRQRNRALELGLRHTDADYLCFLDDDGHISSAYFEALDELVESTEFRDPAAMGGVVDDPRSRPSGCTALVWSRIKRGFFLDGEPGTITRAGWVVQVRDLAEPREVDWIQGSSLCLRRDVAATAKFDERLHTYSWGEDFDLTWRLSRRHRLVLTPAARVFNQLDTADRSRDTSRVERQTVLRHAWVREHRNDGMSILAWWWSVLGELLLYPAVGVLGRRPGWLRETRGIVRGVLVVLSGRSSRTY